jgi:glycosyltransferase involved in cell wall biosynthesis
MLERAIRSVLQQGGDDIEILVVDDASDLPQRIPTGISHHNVRVIRNRTRSGVAISRNVGIESAKGDWIAFLDDDDVWLPGFTQATLAALGSAGSDHAFSWCSIVNIDHANDGSIIGSRPRVFERTSIREQTYQNALSIGTSWGLTVNKRCFERAGIFDPTYKLVEDTEFIMRLLAADMTAVTVEGVFVEIHHHPDPHRMTASSRNGERALEIERLLATYASFLSHHPKVEIGLRAYAASLDLTPAEGSVCSV